MGQIKFMQFYTRLVEHFLRMTVRNSSVTGEVPQYWHSFTTHWIENLSDEDKKFICFVFDKQYDDSRDGIGCYPSEDAYPVKRERLYRLERDFAIAGGLIVEGSTNDGSTES
ncbi:MAG: hypothetical protein LKF32_01730 [Mageeibacillus sp.]|jgi:hypothetical protein|nr:hypothetical protein [Mageeibacillus sp.]